VVRDRAGGIGSGQRGAAGVVSESREEPHPPATREYGVERQRDGRMIPFCRVILSPDLSYVSYGDRSPHLIKSVFRGGKASWGISFDDTELDRGAASRILQGEWKTRKGRFLYRVVKQVMATFDRQGEAKAIAYYLTHGAPIQNVVLRAIRTGDASGFRLLTKCIEAAGRTRKEWTSARKLADAAMRAAAKLKRVPTWQDVRDAFHADGGHLDDANFLRLLQSSGLGWLRD
jgi:hypothetical protein